MNTQVPEPVRLVVWDLDEVFWGGTLTEGGVEWRPENAAAVIELSRRGIINAICSKNDRQAVEAVFAGHKVRDYFVFASIDWSPKGARLAQLVEDVQLRPQSIIFIDDNPSNRAEAAAFVPGLQIADETILPHLLDDPRFRGKPDPECKRLAQYKLLEKRQAERQRAGGDTTAFLRASNIRVSIEWDLSQHVDRAIELINRTNQLNFTKSRLPAEPEAARRALLDLISDHRVSAGILRVQDDYGDYGYCGLYVLRSGAVTRGPVLLQFAFSCRILGLGIETWLYQHLGRPQLAIVPEVVSDPCETRVVDWVRLETPELGDTGAEEEKPFRYVLVRGGCDMRALAHYFYAVADRVIEEFAGVSGHQRCLSSSSVIAGAAIRGGIPAAAVRDSAPLGFAPGDFDTVIAAPPDETPALWLLNFTLEQPVPLLRHGETGALVPWWVNRLNCRPLRALDVDPAESGLDPKLFQHLRARFKMAGRASDAQFQEDLRAILGQARDGVAVFILMANESAPDGSGALAPIAPMAHRNRLIEAVARDFPNVQMIRPSDVMSREELLALERPHHYDRIVYFRIFRQVVEAAQAAARAAPEFGRALDREAAVA